MDKPAQHFLIVAEIRTTQQYVDECEGIEEAKTAIASSLAGLLNPSGQEPFQEWEVVDATVYHVGIDEPVEAVGDAPGAVPLARRASA